MPKQKKAECQGPEANCPELRKRVLCLDKEPTKGRAFFVYCFHTDKSATDGPQERI